MSGKKPLVVDLDGTFSVTDTLLELMASFIGQRPWNIFALVGLLTKDRATLKAELARRAPIDVSVLPLNDDVVQMIRQAKAEKRPVVLATGSDQHIADMVAKEWTFFDEVFSSTPGTNLTSHKKAEALVERFGEKGFDYIGNDYADLAVIAHADHGFLVAPSATLLKKARATGTPVNDVGSQTSRWPGLFRTLRPHQWAKNGLLVIPALAAQLALPDIALPLILGFVFFSLMSSSAYVVNDVLDIQHDRAHRTKKSRPLASGAVSVKQAAAIAPVMAVVSLAGSWFYFGVGFTAVVAAYAVATLAYSTRLKRVALVDVFFLAGLYGVRIFAGAIAVAVPLSPWLITFSLFAFLSLALAKRFTELLSHDNESDGGVRGRGYVDADSPLVAVFGVTSGFIAGVILALYVDDAPTLGLYSSPEILWAVVPIWLYWISRTWLLAHRGTMNDDPVLFALTDRVSYLVGAALVVTLFLAR